MSLLDKARGGTMAGYGDDEQRGIAAKDAGILRWDL